MFSESSIGSGSNSPDLRRGKDLSEFQTSRVRALLDRLFKTPAGLQAKDGDGKYPPETPINATFEWKTRISMPHGGASCNFPSYESPVSKNLLPDNYDSGNCSVAEPEFSSLKDSILEVHLSHCIGGAEYNSHGARGVDQENFAKHWQTYTSPVAITNSECLFFFLSFCTLDFYFCIFQIDMFLFVVTWAPRNPVSGTGCTYRLFVRLLRFLLLTRVTRI